VNKALFKTGLQPGQDIVNRYANDMMAQKYRKAVIKVRTVLSDACFVCIFSMQNWILRVKKITGTE
jgi:hypothetical protein